MRNIGSSEITSHDYLKLWVKMKHSIDTAIESPYEMMLDMDGKLPIDEQLTPHELEVLQRVDITNKEDAYEYLMATQK